MPNLALKPGSTVFLTGVNGLIGSHIADQLLQRGYNVRGAVRDVEKSTWLAEYFQGKFEGAAGGGVKFELVGVPDMTVEGCYDDVVKGTDGFIHVASPLTGSDPGVAIPTAVNGALNALEAAEKSGSVKRFVFTSSSMAMTFPKVDTVFEICGESWNEEGVERAWRHPEGESRDLRGLYVYAGLKTEGERACWRWVGERERGFAFTSVCPNANFGRVLVPEEQGAPSTIDWAKAAFTGEKFELLREKITPQHFISVQDCAMIHISALIYADVANERLLAFAEPFTWNQILGVYRKLFPEREFPEDREGEGRDLSKPRNERALEVLGWVKDGRGWDGLEGSLSDMCMQWV